MLIHTAVMEVSLELHVHTAYPTSSSGCRFSLTEAAEGLKPRPKIAY